MAAHERYPMLCLLAVLTDPEAFPLSVVIGPFLGIQQKLETGLYCLMERLLILSMDGRRQS